MWCVCAHIFYNKGTFSHKNFIFTHVFIYWGGRHMWKPENMLWQLVFSYSVGPGYQTQVLPYLKHPYLPRSLLDPEMSFLRTGRPFLCSVITGMVRPLPWSVAHHVCRSHVEKATAAGSWARWVCLCHTPHPLRLGVVMYLCHLGLRTPPPLFTKFYFLICVMCVYIWKSEASLKSLVFSFYHMGPQDGAQVNSLDGKSTALMASALTLRATSLAHIMILTSVLSVGFSPHWSQYCDWVMIYWCLNFSFPSLWCVWFMFVGHAHTFEVVPLCSWVLRPKQDVRYLPLLLSALLLHDRVSILTRLIQDLDH